MTKIFIDIMCCAGVSLALLMLLLLPFFLRDSKEERRVRKLRFAVEEAELRNKLLKLEGRESETRMPYS